MKPPHVPVAVQPATLPARITDPRLALVLGGGGAKGLAHITVLEVLDEMGIAPSQIAGTSIGAIMAVAYASGLRGRDIRAYVLDVLKDRAEVLRRLLAVRAGRFSDFLRIGLTNPVLIDGERFLDAFLPAGVPETLEALAIPTRIIATDFHLREEVAFASGPLIPAVAASIAIPGVLRPVRHQGRVLIDGGTTNPVPVNHVRAPIVIAVDVLDGSQPTREIDLAIPDPWEAMFGSVTLMMQALSGVQLAAHKPTVHILPPVAPFRVLDFFKAREILAACDATRDDIKRRIARAYETSDEA